VKETIENYDAFRYISTDICFIPNKYGYNTKRNPQYEWKKGLKVSTIINNNGNPLAITTGEGNKNDCKIFLDIYDEIIIDTVAYKYKNSNRYKQYFLADKIYDTNEIKNLMNKDGFNCIIPQNRRNIKDKKKLRRLNNKQKTVYKKK